MKEGVVLTDEQDDQDDQGDQDDQDGQQLHARPNTRASTTYFALRQGSI